MDARPFHSLDLPYTTSPSQKKLQIPTSNLFADPVNVGVEEEKIVEREERAARDLVRPNEMRDVVAPVILADQALACRVYRILVL